MMSHIAPRMKKSFEASLLDFRLASPRMKNITGGPNVTEKKTRIKIPIPSIVKSGLVDELLQMLLLMIAVKQIHGFKGNDFVILVDNMNA